MLKGIPALTDSEVKMLLDSGFIFGSMIFGTDKHPKDTDVDIAIYTENYEDIHLIFDKKVIYQHGYYDMNFLSSYYAHHKGKILNLLVFNDKEMFTKYYHATKILTLLKENDIIKDKMKHKSFRVNLFEFFVNNV